GDEEEIRHRIEQDAISFAALADLTPEERGDGGDGGAGGGGVCVGGDTVVYTPLAVASDHSFNILKFYAMSQAVVGSLLDSIEDGGQMPGDAARKQVMSELPFIPDKAEDRLISETTEAEASSLLLVGRSGTGKTSIAVNRMWMLYQRWHSHFAGGVEGGAEAGAEAKGGQHAGARHYHQVFVTANAVLRDRALKGGWRGSGGAPIEEEYPHTLKDVPEEMFPLFLTQSEWLRLLDGTLAAPFFARLPSGALRHASEAALNAPRNALDALPDDPAWLEEDSDEEEDEAAWGSGSDEEEDAFSENARAEAGESGSKTLRGEGKAADDA
ncbi:hypothetical protein T484DRAFT_1795187, partial [Baffinella frigidus]